MLVISIPDTEVYERGEEGFYTNTEVLSKEKKKKTIIKNVSTRRNLNVDPWANHECRLFLFLKNNPIWGVGGGEISIVPFPREQHWQGVTRLDKTWRRLTESHFWIIGPQHFL